MYFVEIDNKEKCIGFFCDGELHFDKPEYEQLTKTWKYSSSMRDVDHVEYASLYTNGKDMGEFCPGILEEQWSSLNRKMQAYMKSYVTSKVNVNEECVFDLVPDKFLKQYLNTKLEITKNIFQTSTKPDNYDHLLKIAKLIEDIKFQEVVLDLESAKRDSYKPKVRDFYHNMRRSKNFVCYNLFGTKTGRLTTKKKCFPVLTLDKELRKYVKPNNDLFVEVDFNAAELRTLLSLLGKPQPAEDIHQWNSENIFKGKVSRSEAKKRTFAWLYNPNSEDIVLNGAYDRNAIKEKYWDGNMVRTPFHRNIESDEYHSINYALQSTTSDLFLEQAAKIHELLKNKNSFIAFLMHDSIILDFKQGEEKEIRNIIDSFQRTRFGNYRINVKMGKNFGDMRDIEWRR